MIAAKFLYSLLLVFLILIGAESLQSSESVIAFRFYLQDKTAGENATVWRVAQTNFSDAMTSNFGAVADLDNPITVGPEIDSREVGRIQGVIALADFKHLALSMLINVVFIDGEFKGSTLSILGRNLLHDGVREIPVVAGTGEFRLARGYVITTTYYVTDDGSYGVYEYDVVLFVPHISESLIQLTSL